MKNNKLKCFLGIFFIAIIIFTFSSNVLYAATNKNYGESIPVSEVDLNQISLEAGLAEILAKFVYWVACFLEDAIARGF